MEAATNAANECASITCCNVEYCLSRTTVFSEKYFTVTLEETFCTKRHIDVSVQSTKLGANVADYVCLRISNSTKNRERVWVGHGIVSGVSKGKTTRKYTLKITSYSKDDCITEYNGRCTVEFLKRTSSDRYFVYRHDAFIKLTN